MIRSFPHFFFAIALCIPTFAFAQAPTITRTNVESGFYNSERVEYVFSKQPISINLGSPSGSSQTFDYSTVPGTVIAVDTEKTLYLPPGGQTGSASFPTATMAGKLIDSSGGLVITTVQYFRVQDDGAWFLGFAQRTQLGGSDTVTITQYNPAALFLPLPMTLGTSRTSTDTLELGLLMQVTTRSFLADGYGTLSLPNGTVVSALRVITDRIMETFFGGFPFGRVRTRDVEYYGTDLSIASFDAVDTLYSTGATTVNEFEYNVRTGTVDVDQGNQGFPAQFTLYQNYPNPFNPTTLIRFQIPEKGMVSLKMFDMLGRETATLVNEELAPGVYDRSLDGSDLSSGVYYYRLQSNGRFETRKLLLLR